MGRLVIGYRINKACVRIYIYIYIYIYMCVFFECVFVWVGGTERERKLLRGGMQRIFNPMKSLKMKWTVSYNFYALIYFLEVVFHFVIIFKLVICFIIEDISP